MKTYQDFLEDVKDEKTKMDFVFDAIQQYQTTDLYKTAVIADQYDRHLNVTINEYQRLLYTVTGKAVPDNFSANWKMATRFFHRFIVQQTQYLLGNGVSWQKAETAAKMGKDFDTKLQELGRYALIGGVSYGFWNLNHLEPFSTLEFAPIFDEETGGLMAGIRFWRFDKTKPLRATLYEADGYTDYIWRDGGGQIFEDKRPYITKYRVSQADGVQLYDMANYSALPIVLLWGNMAHQSEIIGLREQIDCYDLIKSGFANDIDDASFVFWTIQNAGGMDDMDLAKFVEHMKTVKAATVDDDQKAEAHTMEIPSDSREKLLNRLSRDLYRDAMALDTENIASGAVTATQIKAAYEPLNSKCDDFEYCVRDFLDGILAIVGVEGENPTFTRSSLINTSEEIQTIIQAANYLDSDYVTEKILSVLGDADRTKEMLKKMDADDYERMTQGVEDGSGTPADGSGAEETGEAVS